MLISTTPVIREALDRRLQILGAYRQQVERVSMKGCIRDSLAITVHFKRLDEMFTDLLLKRPVQKGTLRHSESILHDLLSIETKTTKQIKPKPDEVAHSDYELIVSLFMALKA